jgi:uncharacterized paraquat-inducible protein A
MLNTKKIIENIISDNYSKNGKSIEWNENYWKTHSNEKWKKCSNCSYKVPIAFKGICPNCYKHV